MEGKSIGTVTAIQILKSAIGNPVTRELISSVSTWCEKDKKNRSRVLTTMVSTLERHTAKRKSCNICKRSRS